jgi:hypothetical protein
MKDYEDYKIQNAYVAKASDKKEWYIREHFARIFFDVSICEPSFPTKFCRRIWLKTNNKSCLIVIDNKNQLWFCNDVCYKLYYSGPYETEVDTAELKILTYEEIDRYFYDYKEHLDYYVAAIIRDENKMLNDTLCKMMDLAK